MSLNYVMLGANDVAKARAFYDGVIPLIGGAIVAEYLPDAICYGLRDGGRLWLARPYAKQASHPGNGVMLGLKCESRDEVSAAHAKALALGGANEGDPGPRPLYGPDFFGAYVRDLDGNKMSFVHF